MSKRTETKKQKILRIAAKIIAEKGFDGARVDEIAKEADVNKALIYYYFKSKETLLDELLNNLVKESISLETYFAQEMKNNRDFSVDTLMEHIYEFVLEKKEMFMIMMSEMSKGDGEANFVFKYLDNFYIEAQKVKELRQYFDNGFDRMMIGAFFFGTLPVIGFTILKQRWSEHYSIDEKEAKKLFFDLARPFFEKSYEEISKNINVT